MMDFDPNREPVTPRDAASIVLLRARAGGEAEVFLLRRHRGASFMATSYVFPGGIAEEGDADARETAARELFEEAGVLLLDAPRPAKTLAAWREQVGAGGSLTELLAEAAAALSLEGLVPFAHWITPSVEKRRYSARFFLAELPPGQTPSFDRVETVDELWATPDEALARAGELRLPPPQVRILSEIAEAARRGPGEVLAFGRARAAQVQPILPRFALVPDAPQGFALLLPWDPEYASLGQGEALPLPPDHPHGTGPSRFVFDGALWSNVEAEASA